MNKEVEEAKKDNFISEKQIKRVKQTLHELDNYCSDYATDENENIIDEEAYEYADIFNDTWYYIEQLENKVKKLEKQLADNEVDSTSVYLKGVYDEREKW